MTGRGGLKRKNEDGLRRLTADQCGRGSRPLLPAGEKEGTGAGVLLGGGVRGGRKKKGVGPPVSSVGRKRGRGRVDGRPSDGHCWAKAGPKERKGESGPRTREKRGGAGRAPAGREKGREREAGRAKR